MTVAGQIISHVSIMSFMRGDVFKKTTQSELAVVVQ